MAQKHTQSKRQEKSQEKNQESRTSQSGIARRESGAPTYRETTPFSFMSRFSEEMGRLFEDFGFGKGRFWPDWSREFGGLEKSMWSPQVELFERGEKLILRADLPGLTKDNVHVEVTDDAIVLRGERRQEHEESEEGYYRSERSYGSFYRQIPLPAGVTTDEAEASFRNGVLQIEMPAPARQQHSRKIEIGDEEEETKEPVKTRAKGAGR